MALTKAKKSYTGNFKHRIEFWNTVETSDGAGGTEVSDELLDTMWAKVRPVSGSQRLHLQAIQSNVSHTIRIRFRDDIDLSNECWIEWGDRYFNVHYIINQDEERAYMELAATEDT